MSAASQRGSAGRGDGGGLSGRVDVEARRDGVKYSVHPRRSETIRLSSNRKLAVETPASGYIPSVPSRHVSSQKRCQLAISYR